MTKIELDNQTLDALLAWKNDFNVELEYSAYGQAWCRLVTSAVAPPINVVKNGYCIRVKPKPIIRPRNITELPLDKPLWIRRKGMVDCLVTGIDRSALPTTLYLCTVSGPHSIQKLVDEAALWSNDPTAHHNDWKPFTILE